MHFTSVSCEQASRGLAVLSSGKHRPSSLPFPLLSHYYRNYDTTPHTRVRGQKRVTDGNSTVALDLGLNRLGNQLVKAPASRPGPAPRDASYCRRENPGARAPRPQGCLLLIAPSSSRGTRPMVFAGRALPLGCE